MRHLNLKTLGEPPAAIDLNVAFCKVCGAKEDPEHDQHGHGKLRFEPIAPPRDGWNLAATCPDTGKPIEICRDQFFYRAELLRVVTTKVAKGLKPVDFHRHHKLIAAFDDANDGDTVALEDAPYDLLMEIVNGEEWGAIDARTSRWIDEFLTDLEDAPKEAPVTLLRREEAVGAE